MATPIGAYATGPTTGPADALPISPVHITLTGGGTPQWDFLDQNGVSMRLNGTVPWGYNFGEWPFYANSEAVSLVTLLMSQGVRLIRLVGLDRAFSSPNKGDGDGNLVFEPVGGTQIGTADICFNRRNPAQWTKLKTFARACSNLGCWFIIVIEGDILQCGTQDAPTLAHALTLVQPSEVIPNGQSTWLAAGGYNPFTSPLLFSNMREYAKQCAREFRSYPYYFALELNSEPLPYGGGSQYVAGYDFTWTARSPGPGTGIMSLEMLYRTLITDVMGDSATGKPAIDPVHPFIVGGRGGYNLAQDTSHGGEMSELVTALSDPTGLGGNLVAANKLIFTWDRLDSGTTAAQNTPGQWQIASALNVHLFMNQLGSQVSDDTNDVGINLALSLSKAYGVPGTVWELRAKTAGGYGPYYSNGNGDGNGAGGTYSTNAARLANMTARMTESFASILAAANTAATAEGAPLFYVKADFSNVWQDIAGTIPCTAIGQPVGKITPALDPLGTGIFFTAINGTTGRPILGYPQKDGLGNSWLPSKLPSLIFDGANTMLLGNMLFFVPGTTQNTSPTTGSENMTVMAAGIPVTGGVAQYMVNLGQSSGTTNQYPRLGFPNNKLGLFQCEGDDAVAHTVQDTRSTPYQIGNNLPVVLAGVKSGAVGLTSMTLYFNGVQAGAITAQSVGTTAAATLKTLSVGGIKNNQPDFQGPISAWSFSTGAMALSNMHAIGRLMSAYIGSGYSV